VSATGSKTASSRKSARPPTKTQRLARKIHRWAGLTALAWLFVLGATGLVLDHDEWRWARQGTVPESWLSKRVARLLPATLMRQVEVDSMNPDLWLGASERGLWHSEDGGQTWGRVNFEGSKSTPQVTAMVALREGRRADIWMATDDGIWRSVNDGWTARRVAMAGERIISLSPAAEPGALLGILDHERIFRFDTASPRKIEWIDVDAVDVSGLEPQISVADFVFDLHFGYGLFDRTASTLINDFGGLALVILGVSGLFYWWLPRRWRKRRTGGSPAQRRRKLSWLFRSHGPIIGLLAALPILYFSVTGILLDHVFWLLDWGREVTIERTSLTPVYQYSSLRGEIDAIVGYPEQTGAMTVSTRLGILSTTDGGASWRREAQLPASNGTLFRHDDVVFASWTTEQHFFRRDGQAEWLPVEGPTTGLSDATRFGDTWYVKNSRGLHAGTFETGFDTTEFKPPPLDGATLYLFLVDLHTGNVFHPQFIWFNDLISVLAIVLVITGPILWWRKKWR
jgi:hypothetical protein